MSTRPLPSRPNLEYERKQAKKLIAEVHHGDAGAFARVRVQLGESVASSELKLSDAQLTIAREYGFTSWPRLVEYYKLLARHERSQRENLYRLETYEERAQFILRQHANRRAMTAQYLATFVPRFYGLPVDEVLAAPLTLADARLVIARQSRYPSWDALAEEAERQAAARPREGWTYFDSPSQKAQQAIKAQNLPALERIIDEHPELLNPPAADWEPHSIVYSALYYERTTRSAGARRITDWLGARGVDLRPTLNRMLFVLQPPLELVEFALERGADPNWLPPNGISVLEHAIHRYWNGEAVDLIARRVVPRKAFWIAAGLGEVRSLDRYIDRKGALTDAARRNRPDFIAMAPFDYPSPPDADDIHIIWEAFLVAAANSRFGVLDVLLDRGFPVDYSGWGSTLLHMAISPGKGELVEYLVNRGADLEAKGRSGSARQQAANHFAEDPTPERRRILQLCGGRDPETVVRSFEAAYSKPAEHAPQLLQTIQLAQDEATRLGQESVRADNLFIALLRNESRMFSLGILHHSGVDLARLKRSIEHRLVAVTTSGSDLPFDETATAALTIAKEEAERRKQEYVGVYHLLFGLLTPYTGPIANLLLEAGGSLDELREECSRGIGR